MIQISKIKKIYIPKNYPELEILKCCCVLRNKKSLKIQTADAAKLKIVKQNILYWRIWRLKSSQYFSDYLRPLTSNNILLYIFSISTSRVDLTKVGGLAQPWLRFRGRSIAKSGNLRSCSNSSRTVPSNGRFLPEADHGQTKNTGRSRLIS